MKIMYYFLFLWFLMACSNEDSSGSAQESDLFETITNQNSRNKTGNLLDSSAFYADSVIRKYIRETLQTGEKENFTYTIHKAALNPDKFTDAIYGCRNKFTGHLRMPPKKFTDTNLEIYGCHPRNLRMPP